MSRYDPTHFTGLSQDCILPRNAARGTQPYVFNEDIIIAVDVALAIRRPLLVSGEPGSGKSRLADAIAEVLKWNLLSHTMTSRTRIEDLTVAFDHLRRLNDAQLRGEQSALKEDAYYRNPGVLWWAFDRESASRRGMTPDKAEGYGVRLDYPGVAPVSGPSRHAVVLIDEIDKAEPDLPNDLLEPFDRGSFDLPDGAKVSTPDDVSVLIVVTTNGERELPQAFMRRCVTLRLPDPDAEQLVTIGLQHVPDGNVGRMKKIAEIAAGLSKTAKEQRSRPPGASEFLDAVRACKELKIPVDTDPASVWSRIEQAVLRKDRRG